MTRKNRTPEENERRAKIRELLQMGGISSMDLLVSSLKRVSFGVRNFNRFRNRILHCAAA